MHYGFAPYPDMVSRHVLRCQNLRGLPYPLVATRYPNIAMKTVGPKTVGGFSRVLLKEPDPGRVGNGIGPDPRELSRFSSGVLPFPFLLPPPRPCPHGLLSGPPGRVASSRLLSHVSDLMVSPTPRSVSEATRIPCMYTSLVCQSTSG